MKYTGVNSRRRRGEGRGGVGGGGSAVTSVDKCFA